MSLWKKLIVMMYWGSVCTLCVKVCVSVNYSKVTVGTCNVKFSFRYIILYATRYENSCLFHTSILLIGFAVHVSGCMHFG